MTSIPPLETAASPWAARRRRAEELRDRHPFAAEVLTLYLALLDVQEDAWSAARESPPPPEDLARWAAAEVAARGGRGNRGGRPGAAGRGRAEPLGRRRPVDDTLAGWLAGAELDPVDRYLARASLGPALEAFGERAGAACAPGPTARTTPSARAAAGPPSSPASLPPGSRW